MCTSFFFLLPRLPLQHTDRHARRGRGHAAAWSKDKRHRTDLAVRTRLNKLFSSSLSSLSPHAYHACASWPACRQTPVTWNQVHLLPNLELSVLCVRASKPFIEWQAYLKHSNSGHQRTNAPLKPWNQKWQHAYHNTRLGLAQTQLI